MELESTGVPDQRRTATLRFALHRIRDTPHYGMNCSPVGKLANVLSGRRKLVASSGGVINVVIGTLLIGTMLNGMTIMDVSYSGQNLIKGVVLLVAVIADSFLNPRNEETAQQGDI